MSEENVSYGQEPKYKVGEIVQFKSEDKTYAGQIISHDASFYEIETEKNGVFCIHEDNILGLQQYGVAYVVEKPDTDEPENVRWFRRITERMAQIYIAKNADYGDSFGKSVEKYGAIAGLTRISDKFNRLENLILKGDIQVKSEPVEETLLDLSNYCILLYMALKNLDKQEN